MLLTVQLMRSVRGVSSLPPFFQRDVSQSFQRHLRGAQFHIIFIAAQIHFNEHMPAPLLNRSGNL